MRYVLLSTNEVGVPIPTQSSTTNGFVDANERKSSLLTNQLSVWLPQVDTGRKPRRRRWRRCIIMQMKGAYEPWECHHLSSRGFPRCPSTFPRPRRTPHPHPQTPTFNNVSPLHFIFTFFHPKTHNKKNAEQMPIIIENYKSTPKTSVLFKLNWSRLNNFQLISIAVIQKKTLLRYNNDHFTCCISITNGWSWTFESLLMARWME